MPVETPDPPDAKTLARVGLTQSEYGELCRRLGRKPNIVEMGMVGAMWSEHCAYKSSRPHLRKLPTTGPRVLQGPGENAGAVLLTDDLAAVFKIESHNHPSAVEPFQAAATGVGGIIRDIFTMGARPIATLDPLRFGPITNFYDPEIPREAIERNRFLLDGVVAGIAFYGNCVGLPTVGGELVFDASYSLNPLMNGLCLGIVKPGDLIRASARGEGNKVLLVGARTGADGVQGATFASVDLAEDVAQDRPAVQIGDPFLEKCLIEATLALKHHPALVGVQDLGAAGLTSSSCEMAGRGQVGLKLNLDEVPLRQKHIGPYEIMLSESQERMLMILAKDGVDAVKEEFARWELASAQIGEVISEPVVSLWWRGEEVAHLATALLTTEAPEYDRPTAALTKPESLALNAEDAVTRVAERTLPDGFPVRLSTDTPYERALALLLAHPNNASKRLVWRQYDHQVIDNTIFAPEAADAALLRIKGDRGGIAVSTDGPGHLCALDPYLGGMHAVKEAYLNLATIGAEPMAYTNCLNFASPEDPVVMAGFVAIVEG
ncbi:MAG: phosphoribosylformylglycinamidine synthase II, partial [Candidatus Riflebacteria bacterium RBG_13_59_9]